MIVNFFNIPKAFGYITVESRGGFFENVLEIAAKKGHPVWNIRKSKNKILFNAEIKSYRFLRTAARKNQCRIRIARKNGLLFKIKQIRHIKCLPFGIVSFFVTLYTLGGFLFVININGELPIERSKFFEILGQADVTYFNRITDIDAKMAKQTILLNANQLSFVAVNLSYGKADIEIRTQKQKQEVEQGTFGNIVAKRDAIVESIDANSGKPVVAPKDIVKKGQLLIEQSDVNNQNSWVVGTIADVVGITEHRFEVTVNKTETVSTKNDRQSVSYIINFNGEKLIVKPHDQTITLFETNTKQTQLSIFGCELPIYFIKEQIFEVEHTQIERTSRQLEQNLDNIIQQYIEGNTVNGEIIDRTIEQNEQNSSYIFHVTLKMRESIATSIWQIE